MPCARLLEFPPALCNWCARALPPWPGALHRTDYQYYACEESMFVATAAEQEAGGLAPPKLADVMAAFERDGYVVRLDPTRAAGSHPLCHPPAC